MKHYKRTKMKGGNMKYLSILLLIITIAITVPSLAVVETLGTFKQDSCVPLIQACSTCAYNNISSIINPSGTYSISSETVMIKSGTKYSYSFCNTSVIGRYIVTGHGDLEAADAPWGYDFYISTTGDARGTTLPLFLAISGLILFIIAIWIENEWIGFIAGSLFIIDGIYLMVYGLNSIADTYTRALAFVALGFGLIIVIAAGYEAISREDEGLFGTIKESLSPSEEE